MPAEGGKSRFYEFADFRVDAERRLLTRSGEPVSVTPKVFEMLVILLEHPGELITKATLMELLWPDSFVEESNLTQNVAVLRRALGDSSKQPRFILTVPGQGYRFLGDVRGGGGVNGILAAPVTDPASSPSAPAPRREGSSWLMPAGLLAVIVGGLFLWFVISSKLASDPASIERTGQVTSWSGLDFYPSISPDGNSIVYSSDRSGSFEIYVKQLVQSAREVQLTSDGGQNFQPKFSPDGSMVAYHSKRRGGIWVIPTSGGTAKQVSDFGSAPAWSPDGSQIAFQSDPLNDLGSNVRNAMPPSTIWIVPSRGGEPRQVTRPGDPPGGHGAPSWSPDGKTIVFDTNDWNSSMLAWVNVETGEIKRHESEMNAASDAVYMPDGQSIIFIAESGLSIQSLPLSSSGEVAGKPVKLFDASGTRLRQPSIDAKGRRLVYASLTSASNIWSAGIATGARPMPNQLTKNAVTRTSLPRFSPDGKKIAYQAFTIGAVSHLWTMNSDGTDQKQISSRPGFSSSWSRDGSRIYFVSPENSKTSLWYVTADAAVERKVFDFDEEIYNVQTSPDATQAVISSKRSGVMNLWLVPFDQSGLKQITFDPEFAGFPCWSPDGQWIAMQLKRGDHTYVAGMPAVGGEPVQLNADAGQSWIYDWSPDSDKVLFAGQRDGIWNIYWVSRTTKEQGKLTDFTKLNSFVRYPTWSPLNDQIAFEYSETTGNIWMADLK